MLLPWVLNILSQFLKQILFILERGEGREKQRDGNIDVREKHRLVALHTHSDLGPNQQPRHCPDWESNW